MLLQAAWLAPRKRPLPIYLPGELIKPLLAWLDAVYLPPALLGFSLELCAWRVSEKVELLRGARALLPQIGEITAVGDGERIWF